MAEVPWVSLIWNAHYDGSVPHVENPCGSFWWKDIMKLVGQFRSVSSVVPGKGNTFMFWEDAWALGDSTQPLALRYPRLFSYVLDRKMSAAEVYGHPDMLSLFYLPLSEQAFEEFQELSAKMELGPLSLENDRWIYSWGTQFSAAQYYKHVHQHQDTLPMFKWIWSSSCMLKFKFFAWLLLSDRLNTKDLLQRRHWQVTEDYSCVLCVRNLHEDRMHLFFECQFSQRVWSYLQIDWFSSSDVQTAASAARVGFNKPFFMEVVILACWNIWKQRNGKIFEARRPSFAAWKRDFVHDLSLLGHRIKYKYHSALMAWIGSLL